MDYKDHITNKDLSKGFHNYTLDTMRDRVQKLKKLKQEKQKQEKIFIQQKEKGTNLVRDINS